MEKKIQNSRKFNKNEIVTVEITDIGINGEGIGRVEGYTLFVKDAIIGDIIEAKITKAEKNYGYARVEKINVASKDRVEPFCPVARSCGGCQIQEMDYKAQLEFKKNKVKNNIERIGKLSGFEIYDTLGMENPVRYRNKAQFPFGTDKNGEIITGFYAGRTHSIISNEDCGIGIEENKDILNIIKLWMKENGVSAYNEENHIGCVRHALIRKGFKTGEIMVCLVINARKLPNTDSLVSELCKIDGMTSISYSINTDKTNVIMGLEIVNLYGQGYITDYIGDVKFSISPLSFYQVNPVQTQVLYGKALEFAGLTGKEVVWDMYCGVGTISLFLAAKAKKVYGVEIIPEAIDDARNNAKINGIENVEFFVGKAEEVFPRFYEETHEYADVVVVDPPRKGCDVALLETMLMMKPERIVYVSCDSSTLARDLGILSEGGYKVQKVQPVDMFPHSGHVETVVLLSK